MKQKKGRTSKGGDKTRKGTRQRKIQKELTRARYGYRIFVGEKTYNMTYQEMTPA
jgi:hypothetical protein